MAGKVNFNRLDGSPEDQLATWDAFFEAHKDELDKWEAEHPEEADEDE